MSHQLLLPRTVDETSPSLPFLSPFFLIFFLFGCLCACVALYLSLIPASCLVVLILFVFVVALSSISSFLSFRRHPAATAPWASGSGLKLHFLLSYLTYHSIIIVTM